MTGDDKNVQDPSKRQRARSMAIAWSLAILALLFYAATIVRLGPNALRRDDFNKHSTSSTPVEEPACKKDGTC